MTKNLDKDIEKISNLIKEKKELLKKQEEESVKSNRTCQVFTLYNEKITLNVADEDVLIKAMKLIMLESELHNKAMQELNLKDKKLVIAGYSYEDWVTDIKSRLAKIQLKNEKLKLNRLEAELEKLLSENQRRRKGLDSILVELNQ